MPIDVEIDYKGMSAEDIAGHLGKINKALEDWAEFWGRINGRGDKDFIQRLNRARKNIKAAIKELGNGDDD